MGLHLNVGKNIIYTASRKNNSDEFSISRGIRQGCPVLALLFILAIELFGLRIRQEIDIKGFEVGFPEKPHKMVQYADDCILLLNNIDELCTAISILDFLVMYQV